MKMFGTQPHDLKDDLLHFIVSLVFEYEVECTEIVKGHNKLRHDRRIIRRAAIELW